MSRSDEQFDWNEDIRDDLDPESFRDLIVYSRDWTVETIINQMAQGNIELNPKFQRRNAWTDERRSLLIESLLAGVPVPEIVLAEAAENKRKFLVLDGKQRLLAIAGFIASDKFEYWDKPQLTGLKLRSDLNDFTYPQLKAAPPSGDPASDLSNAAVRCTVLSNWKTDDALYNIFYRLNTGSVPLSTQELRQVLSKGPFADYLIDVTNKVHPVQRYLNLDGPDPRLRDVEILLRFFALELFAQQYHGNLKKFLDLTMRNCNDQWSDISKTIHTLNKDFADTADLADSLFGKPARVGRKFVDNKWEGRFNKALFDVEMYFLNRLRTRKLSKARRETFLKRFQIFCAKDPDFMRSIEVTTKSMDQYRTRFAAFQRFINEHFAIRLNAIPEWPQ